MSTPGRIWRSLVGAGSLAIAFRMAHVIDLGVTESLTSSARYSWGVGMFILMLFGLGCLVQVVRPLLGGGEVRWFPQRADLTGAGGLVAVLSVGVAILVAVVGIGLIRPQLIGRAAVAGGGAFVLFLALARARGFWQAGSIQVWRSVLGDRLVVAFYAALGVGLIALALLAKM